MSANEQIAQAGLAIESGRALFREGIVSECQAYLALALRSLLSAWAPRDSAEPVPSVPSDEQQQQALVTLARAKYPRVERLSSAYRAVTTKAPRTGTPNAPLREQDLDFIWAEVDRLHRFTLRHFMPVETQRRLRVRLALVLVPLALVAIAWLSFQRSRPHVAASASFGDPYPPEHVVDSLDATEWLLPDGAAGWVDLIFKAPRTVHSVTLVNCHNGGFSDRGSARVRVTAFANDTAVSSVEGAFSQISGERSALNLAVKGEHVTRVRAEVLSVFGRGGGFAEVEVH